MSATKSALDEFFALYDDDADRINECRAELSQLRADLQAAQERIAEQARQLDAAREIIESGASLYSGSKSRACAMQLYDDWLGHYVLQRIVDGAYVDVQQLIRDEAMTYRTRQDEALKLVWKQ